MKVGKAQPCGIVPYVGDFPFRQITGKNRSRSIQKFRRLTGLAPGRGADIQNEQFLCIFRRSGFLSLKPDQLADPRAFHRHHAGRVLHGEGTFRKARQGSHALRALQHIDGPFRRRLFSEKGMGNWHTSLFPKRLQKALPLFLRKPLRQADGQRTFFQKGLQHSFRLFCPILFQPSAHNPFRHGIADGKETDRLLFPIRPGNGVFLRTELPEHAVHKTGKLGEAALFGKLHRFVAGGGIRHAVHEQDLISSHTQNAADQRLHLPHGKAGKLFQHVVQLKAAFRHAVHKALQKSLIPAVQIIIFVQCAF